MLHFWKKVTQLFKKLNFEINISLKHLVFGYKIFDKEYFDFSYILTINKGNNKITKVRTILQRESQNS